MTRALATTLALAFVLTSQFMAFAEPPNSVDPYVNVAKGARAKPVQSASLPSPSPDRFGPVVLSPATSDIIEQQPVATFDVPAPTEKPLDAICALSSTLSGKAAKALIAKIATEEEFDLTLLNAIAQQESDFRMDQRSPAGALGLMQLMPATAKSLGVDPCEPEQNIRGSIKLLRLLNEKYSGNIIYMLAAYNAGEDAVDRNGGIPPYRETITYVTRILSTLNGWELPRSSKAASTTISKNNNETGQEKPAANRWAQGFVLHVE